jgi:hypothetical protein
MNGKMKSKMIFAKATISNFCAITVFGSQGKLIVCDVVESENITAFIDCVASLARKHKPELLQYECSVFADECRVLRELLCKDDIRVRGYKSDGAYLNRIVSQHEWITDNVCPYEEFASFIDLMLSFSLLSQDKTNIALDILSDATKYLRRYYF